MLTLAARRCVSVLFSEPKIPQLCRHRARARGDSVSVLFSEPKIPQSAKMRGVEVDSLEFQCSSASRKFLNDAQTARFWSVPQVSVLFSEPKIPQSGGSRAGAAADGRFSALQRAENSSIGHRESGDSSNDGFQCSSASRKFLNPIVLRSAYVQANVSVLFSEPKIPQSKGSVP